jgi:hypothetical protein
MSFKLIKKYDKGLKFIYNIRFEIADNQYNPKNFQISNTL